MKYFIASALLIFSTLSLGQSNNNDSYRALEEARRARAETQQLRAEMERDRQMRDLQAQEEAARRFRMETQKQMDDSWRR